ncbi:MAG TPA: S4 domain-containing protein, partial [Candidatus Hydrogenedentes bacterium]|nr:S4 domain-containing protein [Candidatus Hydrogenedentota bacterium]
MRLQRYLALCGIASRRASETLIRDGRVTVNGAIA